MNKTTNITNLLDDDNDDDNLDINNLDLKDLQKVIFDLSLSLSLRRKAIQLYYIINTSEIVEIINKLCGMYTFSGTSLLENYINDLCLSSNISINLKILLVTALTTPNHLNKVSKYGFCTLNILCKDLKDLPTPIKIETIKILMKDTSNLYKIDSMVYFNQIINNSSIDCPFRYKSILSLESISDNFYIKESMYSFLNCNTNLIRYRILSAQYLLQNNLYSTSDFDIIKQIYEHLLCFANDHLLDTNVRADATDVILRYGDSTYILLAREIIKQLGSIKGKVVTIYDNAQNVHSDKFEEKIVEGINFLSSIPLMKINNIEITFEFVFEKIKDLIDIKYKDNDKNIVDSIYLALNRIQLDRALYSKFNASLINILLKVWTYIEFKIEFADDMKNRLLEELIDMSGTCSTGYVERLINVISGYSEFNYTISWEDQITANLTGRLNAQARNINTTWKSHSKLKILIIDKINTNKDLHKDLHKILQNSSKLNPTSDELFETYLSIYSNEDIDEIVSEFQENVINEMTIHNYNLRKNFLIFYRHCLLHITEELYQEFKDHISDSDFNLYMRKALYHYEGFQ